jgi:hypothetical protein
MRLAIPRRPRLRGRRWKVHRRKIGGGLVGLCELETRRITIHPRQTRRTRELIYVHELLHAIFPAGVVSGEDEEAIILRLEEPLRRAVLDGALMPVPEEA